MNKYTKDGDCLDDVNRQDLDAFKASMDSEDAFDNWKREEFVEENLTGEGIYLGDGVYI